MMHVIATSYIFYTSYTVASYTYDNIILLFLSNPLNSSTTFSRHIFLAKSFSIDSVARSTKRCSVIVDGRWLLRNSLKR